MLDALHILQEAYECGILDATEVAMKIKMTKEAYVKERHSYSISTRKNGRIITTVRKEEEERQNLLLSCRWLRLNHRSYRQQG